jgi:hypothetical protein
MPDVNVGAVIVAALSSFLLGGLWYSKVLFHGAWERAADVKPDPAKTSHGAAVFGLSFVLALVGAYVFAWWIGPAPALGHAVKTGATIGAAFVATSFGINYLFSGRRFALWAIDAGYHLVQFTLFGLVLGLWP